MTTQQFLDLTNTTISIKLAHLQNAPRWAINNIYGLKYGVIFSQPGKEDRHIWFWGSYNDKLSHKEAIAEDVLCAIIKYAPGTFNDFCECFGYNIDSRKDYVTYKALVKEWNRITRYYFGEHLDDLREFFD